MAPLVRLPVAALIALLAGCGTRAPAELRGETMGTTWSLQVGVLPGGVDRARVESVVTSILDEIDTALSTWSDHSEITALNRSTSTDWIAVSKPLYDVLAAAQRVSRESGGAFDCTVGPLVDLWGFGARRDETVDWTPPRADEIAAARARVGAQLIELRDRPRAARKLAAGIELDVAGIAPGYAVDRIAGALDALGVADYLVEIGGEVRSHGRSPAGRPWRVAIERPLPGVRLPYALVELTGTSISTSGDYRDFHLVGEHRISHTIDPASGAPVTHDLAAVSVIHPSTMLADAYATALMVLGPSRGYEFARRARLPALFIEHTPAGGYSERSTPEFARYRIVDRSLPDRT